jgi:methylated-DNA-protein-cysteine methyltransferase-like protein
MPSLYPTIYAVVQKIPRGRVATYGQVARLAGIPRHARQVGHALSALPEGSRVPWQRVVNAQGEISIRSTPEAPTLQRRLLQKDGVRFNPAGRVVLKRFQWKSKR